MTKKKKVKKTHPNSMRSHRRNRIYGRVTMMLTMANNMLASPDILTDHELTHARIILRASVDILKDWDKNYIKKRYTNS